MGFGPRRRVAMPSWLRDPLYRNARAVPKLDLNFANSKALTDAITGSSLITFTRASSGTYIDSARVLQTASTNVARFDHNPTTGESLGLLVEEARTNLLLNSATLSTQSVTVTAVAHTLSFYGTGTVTLTGTSTAGPAVGTGAFPTRTTLTFTPTAGALTLTGTGSVTSAQLEVGAFPTSYIATAGTTITRSADVVSITGANFSGWYNSAGGVCYVESRSSISAASVAQFSFNDATANNRVTLFHNSSNILAGRNTAAAGALFTPVVQAPLAVGTNKVALSFANLDIALAANGGTVGAASTYNVPTVTQLEIGQQLAGGNINGTIRRLTYWPTRLSNSALQRMTA